VSLWEKGCSVCGSKNLKLPLVSSVLGFPVEVDPPNGKENRKHEVSKTTRSMGVITLHAILNERMGFFFIGTTFRT